MKPTNQILRMLEQRREAGKRTNSLDCKIIEWFDKHGVPYEDHETGDDLANSIMLVTEPEVLFRLSVEVIRKFDRR
jgi:hypothetical protein